VLAVSPVRLALKEPKPVPISTLLPAIVGLLEVPYTIPLADTLAPPVAVTLPLAVAVVEAMLLELSETTVGVVASVSNSYTTP